MKSIKFLSPVLLGLLMTFASCKGDGAATADERESLATTNTTESTITPTPAPGAEEVAIPAGPLTTIDFPETTFDFGDIKDGEKIYHEFKFKNTGSEPLIISNAKGSCGCTVPDWPREPVAVGATAIIKVQYDSKGKGQVEGRVESKTVTITANTDPAQSFLKIKGKVFKDAEPAS